jgi:hypothetical protein
MGTSADDDVIELGKLVSSHPAYDDADWSYIALVTTFAQGRRSMLGYVFFADGHWEAKLPRDRERTVMKAFRQLHERMAAADGMAWLQCLMEVSRQDHTVAVQFEYDDPNRWSVTPDKLEEQIGELSPR